MPKFKKNPNPIMKKQGYGEAKSPFMMKSSPARYYQELEAWNKFKKAGKIGAKRLFGGLTAMGTSAYGIFKGYGKLAKTKHGKQIIKDSGVGRTRKI